MTLAIFLFVVALAMNAFFSGAETGFFRMTRLRLVMEAKDGDRASRLLLWFSNQPSVLVATALVGNNTANFVTSYAVVMGSEQLYPNGGIWASVLPPLVVAPFMFICGDLLPKNVYFNAPNRLMRRSAPALAVSAALFAPVTFLLWLLSLALKVFSSEGPQELRLSLARRELNAIMVEGHEAGILLPVQRTLAQTMLAMAGQPIKNFAAPAARVVRVTTTMTRSDMLRIAQRHRRTLLPMEDPQNKRALVGFVRTIDLMLGDAATPPTAEPLVELAEHETFLSALGKLGVAQDALGHVVNSAGKTIGFVAGRDLRMALLQAQ